MFHRNRKHHHNNDYKDDKIEIIDFESGTKAPFNSSIININQIKEHFYKNPEEKLVLNGYEFFKMVGEIREQENQKAYDKSFDVIYELVTALKKKESKNESDKKATVQKSSPNKDN